MGKIRIIFLCLATMLLSLAYSVQSEAAPLGFKRPRATFALGLDAFDALTGEFGKASEAGMSVFAESSLQLAGYFGVNIRFGSARAFTDKDFLPFDEGYQYIYAVLGPRFYLAPFRKLNLYFYAQPEIAMQVLVSNTLVSLTGNRQFTGAAGGSIGAQFLLGILSISGQVTCQYNWNLHTVILGGGLSIGVSSNLK